MTTAAAQPPKQEDEYLTIVETFFDDEEMRLLCAYAEATGVPMGQLIRSCMRELLLDDARQHGSMPAERPTFLN